MKGIEIDSRARITCKIWLMSECEYRVWGVWGVECRSQEGEGRRDSSATLRTQLKISHKPLGERRPRAASHIWVAGSLGEQQIEQPFACGSCAFY